MKSCYINSAVSISTQDTFNLEGFLDTTISHESDVAHAIHPNYKDFIDPKAIRRMATGVKMGIAASKFALETAQIEQPDAIITGTGMGCIKDSEKFLNAIIDNDEQFLTPTSFIQSTHNTVGAQIALILKCKNYNVSYVHGSASFESALLDGQLMLHEEEAKHVLVGGIDELSNTFAKYILQIEQASSQPVSVPFAEGAHFFTLANTKTEKSCCELSAVDIINTATPESISQKLIAFIERQKLDITDIDAIVLGNNGDAFDMYYNNLQQTLFKTVPQVIYKPLCGEFSTASAFGFWTAVQIIKTQSIPKVLLHNPDKKRETYKTVILYNQFKGQQHSFTLLSSC